MCRSTPVADGRESGGMFRVKMRCLCVTCAEVADCGFRVPRGFRIPWIPHSVDSAYPVDSAFRGFRGARVSWHAHGWEALAIFQGDAETDVFRKWCLLNKEVFYVTYNSPRSARVRVYAPSPPSPGKTGLDGVCWGVQGVSHSAFHFHAGSAYPGVRGVDGGSAGVLEPERCAWGGGSAGVLEPERCAWGGGSAGVLEPERCASGGAFARFSLFSARLITSFSTLPPPSAFLQRVLLGFGASSVAG